MKFSPFKIVSLIFFSFVFCLQLNAQSEYQLNYKFKEGKTYNYTNLLDANAVMQIMGQEMKSGSLVNLAVKFKVDSVKKDKDMVIITTIDSGSVKVHSPMKDTTISLSMLAGKRIKLVMNEQGKIKSRKMLDSIDQALVAGLNSQETIRFFKLPVNKVKVGETWKSLDVDTTKAMGGTMVSNLNASYTLAGKEQKLGYNCIKITFTGDVKNEGNALMMGQKLFIEGSGKISGALFFEPTKGILVQSESNSDLEMTMATTGDQNMIIPLTQSVKNTMTIAEKP